MRHFLGLSFVESVYFGNDCQRGTIFPLDMNLAGVVNEIDRTTQTGKHPGFAIHFV